MTAASRADRVTVRMRRLPGAACAVADPGLFFPPDGELAADRGRRQEHALAICAACPVRLACLGQALTRGEPWGIWGGVDFEEPGQLRRAS